jgi:outer membrane protein assembly factor BamB
MSGHMTKLSVLPGIFLAAIAVLAFSVPASAAEREARKDAEKAEKKLKETQKKDKLSKDKKDKEEPGDAFKPTPAYEKQVALQQETMAEIEASVAARNIPLPSSMHVEVEWYSPHVKAEYGRVIKGWVKEDLILLETDKKFLIAIRRSDGVERWRCELTEPIRYEPCVSRNNVVVNLNNHLVAIEKNAGDIRWKLLPNFVMSCSPLMVDPPAYPREYGKDWSDLEHVYVGGWDGRFHCMTVRARMSYYIRKAIASENFAAPEFQLFYPWHKTHKNRGIIQSNITLRDNLLYYTANDNQCYAVSREGEERQPYFMLDEPATNPTITGGVSNNLNSVMSSFYVGSRDNNLYCLDRLTLKKKWAYPAGSAGIGSVLADEQATPYVYFATSDGKTHALQLTPTRSATKSNPEAIETATHAWDVAGQGAITAGPNIVYVGANRSATFPGFTGVTAVNKHTGKVLWSEQGGEKAFFTSFLEFHNSWSTDGARLFAITADNRLVSLKERAKDTALQVEAAPVDVAPKIPTPKKAEAPKEGGAAAE